jgi:hypothetical protein
MSGVGAFTRGSFSKTGYQFLFTQLQAIADGGLGNGLLTLFLLQSIVPFTSDVSMLQTTLK